MKEIASLDTLTPEQNDIRRSIIALLQRTKRKGIQDLIKYLDETDFYLAPASTRFHAAYDGGLAYHSLMVCEAALSLYNDFYPQLLESRKWLDDEIKEDSVILATLLHDLCKIDTYVPGFRNVKDDTTGKWEKVATYTRDPQLAMGHGGKSVYIIQKYIQISDREAQAIYWHMGAYDISLYMTLDELSKAFESNFLAFLLHQADMMTTYVLENNRYLEVR